MLCLVQWDEVQLQNNDLYWYIAYPQFQHSCKSPCLLLHCQCCALCDGTDIPAEVGGVYISWVLGLAVNAQPVF